MVIDFRFLNCEILSFTFPGCSIPKLLLHQSRAKPSRVNIVDSQLGTKWVEWKKFEVVLKMFVYNSIINNRMVDYSVLLVFELF